LTIVFFIPVSPGLDFYCPVMQIEAKKSCQITKLLEKFACYEKNTLEYLT